MSDEDIAATGSPFSQALFRDYTDLGTQAAAAPAPPAMENDGGFLDDLLNVFDTGPANPADAVADAFRAKANRAAGGEEPAPEPAPGDATCAGPARPSGARHRRKAKTDFPSRPPVRRPISIAGCLIAARQSDQGSAGLPQRPEYFAGSAGKCRPPGPAAAAGARLRPRPCRGAAAPSDYTVYFDLDSWTLTAEDLAVITNVINTARAGGQSHITIVGHTDTSGSAGL